MRVLTDYEGLQSGASYNFRGASGPVAWPKDPQLLAPGGAINLLERMGFGEVRAETRFGAVQGPAVLLLLGAAISKDSRELIEERRLGGPPLIVAGRPESVASLVQGDIVRGPWTSGIAARTGDSHWLLSGEGTEIVCRPSAAWTRRGDLYFVHGQRSDPARASRSRIPDAHAVLTSGSVTVLNGNPFAVLQRWLQCETDLFPWLGWYPPLAWLDHYMNRLAGCLVDTAPSPLHRSQTESVSASTIVLRHDVDSSTSPVLLELTERAGVPSTYALLDDRDLRYWVTLLNRHQHAELAFHYDTAVKASAWRLASRRLRGRPLAPIQPSVRRVAGGGLNSQIRRVSQRGLTATSIHRHLNFIYYPEWVEAVSALDESSRIAAASSLSRGRVIRFSAEGNGLFGPEMPSPLVQVPSWGRVTLWNSATRRPALAREAPSLMEPEPEVLLQVASTELSHLSAPIVTACYHPAHATSDTIVSGGTAEWVREVVEGRDFNDFRFSTFTEAMQIPMRSTYA